MARSHHRKKHREHVKQFRQSHDTATSAGSNGKATTIVIVGGLVGFAVAFFASGGVLLWMTLGLILGAAGGYFAGKKIDEGN